MVEQHDLDGVAGRVGVTTNRQFFFVVRPRVDVRSAGEEDAIEPTEETVLKGITKPGEGYPIWRYLYIYVNPAQDKGEVAAYLNWTRSDDGQKIVKDVGYFPLPAHLRQK